MPSTTRIQTWLAWSIFAAALTGLSFALNVWWPPQPRFVLRGDGNVVAALSPDGKILTTRAIVDDVCVSLKTWDTFTGQQRHEFFRGTAGFDPSGYLADSWVHSPDRRFCALLHPRGLGLADLNSGKEWPEVIRLKIQNPLNPEALAIFGMLRKVIQRDQLPERFKLKDALKSFADQFDGKLTFRVDHKAFAATLGAEMMDPSEEEVGLPTGISRMRLSVALSLVVSQVGKGSGRFEVRPNCIEIVPRRDLPEERITPPKFSPRGTFLVQVEERPDGDVLHVVECATGQREGGFAVRADGHIGFTPDDELLCFFAPGNGVPIFTLWSTRKRQVVRTIADIDFRHDLSAYLLAPDGKTMLANTAPFDPGGVDLFDLHTGQKRRCFVIPGVRDKLTNRAQRRFLFAPDSRTLVKITPGQAHLWDISSGKMQGKVKLPPSKDRGDGPALFISADSGVLCTFADDDSPFGAWRLATGERLWPSLKAAPEVDVPPFPPIDGGPQEVAVEQTGGLRWFDDYAQFTPDHRFLVERTKNHIDLLDPATGKPAMSVAEGSGYVPNQLITFTPDGQSMLSRWVFERPDEPWFLERWLGDWWPFQDSSAYFIVSDLSAAQARSRLKFRGPFNATAQLSDDGRTLLTTSSDGSDTSIIECWDVPGRTSRLLVFGIPLALAGAAVVVRMWVQRRNRGS